MFDDAITPIDWLWEPEITAEIDSQVQAPRQGRHRRPVRRAGRPGRRRGAPRHPAAATTPEWPPGLSPVARAHRGSMHAMSGPSALQPFYEGWADHQRLAGRHRRSRPGPARAAAGTGRVVDLAARRPHGRSRAYWIHDILGEGDAAVRDMFRVAQTTVPDLPLEMAGWEDDEAIPGRRPRSPRHSS